MKKDIVFLSHTRLFNPLEPEKKWSTVWEDVKFGVITEVDAHPTLLNKCTVFATKDEYHSMPVYLLLLREAVALNPAAIVMPFTPASGKYEDELIEILKTYKGVIIAVTAGPSEKAQKELPNLRGFVGPDEGEMGRLAAAILSDHKAKHVIIPSDKPDHAGYLERIKAITEVAAIHGVESVKVIPFVVDDDKTFDFEPEEDTIIIGLGPMGTKFALRAKKNYPDRVVGISTMDMSDETKEAIKMNVLYAVIQNPKEQGAKAVRMAIDILEGKTSVSYREIFCRAKIVSTLLVLLSMPNTILKTHCKCNVSRRL